MRVIGTYVDRCHYSETGWGLWQIMAGGGTRCTCKPVPAPCDERPQGQDPKGLEAKPASAVTDAKQPAGAQPEPSS